MQNAALSTISVDDALTQAIHGIPVEEDDESDFDGRGRID